jgi:glucosamine kinase
MSAYVAGIDGGQSTTVAAIGDERGRIVGRGSAGPADEVGAGPDSSRLRDALAGALDAARRDARLPEATRYHTIVAGISGYAGCVRGMAPALPTERLTLLHDAPIAHAGALYGEPGIVVIAGTGSFVYGRAPGVAWTAGGWGYLFGDEGSAFWLAREALATLMRWEDDGTPHVDEGHAACDFFGLPSIREVARATYAGEIERAALAGFAPVAMRFEPFRAIALRGADRLAALVGPAVEAGVPPTVACAGGMFRDEDFARRFERSVAAAIPTARVIAARYEPSIGALSMAYREAGLGPFAAISVAS